MDIRKISLLAPLAALAVVLAVAQGCGSKSEDAESSASTPAASTASGGTTMPAVSPFDSGPRANATPANHESAEHGKELFSTKGCSACHAFGKKITGPDLSGVTGRRTAQWIQNQILHPEVMTKNDPISHQLLATYAIQMPNQGLTEAEALQVIEFFKQQDAAGGATAHEEEGHR